MTKNEIKKWYADHDEELRPDPQRRWIPTLKPLRETIDLACNMPELGLANMKPEQIRDMIGIKLMILGLPSRAVTAYVNYTGHNALSIRELAFEMEINKDTVVVWFKRLRQEWPQLFNSALLQELNAELAIQAERDKSLVEIISGR